MILLVVGAGGFFGKVLAETGVGEALAGSLQSTGLPLLVSAYVISSGLRIAQGSATVAIVTTGGIVAPLLHAGEHSQAQLENPCRCVGNARNVRRYPTPKRGGSEWI